MKLNTLNEELKQQVTELLDNSEDKNEAVYQAIDMIVTAKNADLINQIIAENQRAEYDAEYRKQLNLRTLSEKEKEFYEKIKDIKQSITANQIDILPDELIDRTLDDVKKKTAILSLINMAPVGVKRWLVASHSGAAVWGNLTDEISGELTASIESLSIDVNKLMVFLIIPKAIADLALPFVDRYFSAILAEALQDGLVKGYLDGNGKTEPIGIMRKIDESNADGSKKAKTVCRTLTKFSPKGLADVRKTLTHNGKRAVSELYLLCNPADEAEYIDPCMFGEVPAGGYKEVSFVKINKIADPNVPAGKGIFTIKGYYYMGMSNIRVDEYKETKAMDDANVAIGKCYANGRATDDDVAVVFDVTKLEEYVPRFFTETVVSELPEQSE